MGIGIFYPANAMELLRLLKRLERGGGAGCGGYAGSVRGHVKAVLVPHGELRVSGSVALAGVRCLSEDYLDTVVVVGANHAGLGLPVAAYPGGSWITPLGEIEVDGAFVDALVRLDEFLDIDEEAHRDEHSVEIVLVLLQYLFNGRFRFVPIVLSDTTMEVAESLARSIHTVARQLKRRVIVVASVNLGLEPSRTRVEGILESLLNPLLAMNGEEFYATVNALGAVLCNPSVALIPALYAKLQGGERGVIIDSRIDKACVGVGYAGYVSMAWM